MECRRNKKKNGDIMAGRGVAGRGGDGGIGGGISGRIGGGIGGRDRRKAFLDGRDS